MKRELCYALFDTVIGRCGIAWSERGVVRMQLPEATPAKAVQRLTIGDIFKPAEPPPAIAAAIERICRHLAGDGQDLRDIPLDTSGVPDFHQRVYRAARAIPAGRTVTYGELAARIGSPGAARAVGQALGKNPFAVIVPCHRILAAGGKTGGFSAYGGIATKQRVLRAEGVDLASPSSPRPRFRSLHGRSA